MSTGDNRMQDRSDRLLGMSLFLCWLSVASLVSGLHFAGVTDRHITQAILALLGLAHCVAGFWKDGGSRISVPGMTLFGFGLFIYFPSLYYVLQPDTNLGWVDLVAPTFLALIGQLVLYYLVWSPTGNYRRARPAQVVRSSAAIVPVGVLLIIMGVVVELVTGSFVGDASAYVGIVLLAIGTVWSRQNTWLKYLLLAIGFLIYLEVIFGGFGRLKVGSLGLAVVSLLSWRWLGNSAKIALVAVTLPALSFFAAHRVEFSSESRGISSQATGLESVIGPMARFGQLLELVQSGQLEMALGSTFLVALVALVPRGVWPDKPIGFGSELAYLFNPELAPYGHSNLALLHGELIYNFGLPGIALLLIFFGVFVNRLDLRLAQVATRPQAGTFADALRVALMTVLASSMVDLIWGGTFHYVARTGVRVLVICALAFIVFISHEFRHRNSARHTAPSASIGFQAKRHEASSVSMTGTPPPRSTSSHPRNCRGTLYLGSANGSEPGGRS